MEQLWKNGKVLRAARFAAHAHRHRRPDGKPQVRKKTGDPYERHPGRVASMVMLLDGVDGLVITEDHVAAAWLHDVLEDCTVFRVELEAEFGEEAARIVVDLTNKYTSKSHPEMNRAERKRRELELLANLPRETRAIKLVDRFDNLREIDETEKFSRVYLQESKDLLASLEKDLPTITGWLRLEVEALEGKIAKTSTTSVA